MAVGDDAARRDYVNWLRDNCSVISPSIVWNAIDALFPKYLSVENLLEILPLVNLTDRDGGLKLKDHPCE